jgi:aryl sulfotransferase
MSTLDPKWGTASAFHDPNVLAHFVARPSDVLITTAPKAGTTWMQQILHQLRTGGDAQFESIFDEVPWLELPRPGVSWTQALADYERRDNPRLFKTHCTYSQTPGTDVARIILTVRDPRDCCVSFFHHVNGMNPEAMPGMPASMHFDDMQQCVDGFLSFGAWYRNVASWWPHRADPNVLLLRYQDVSEDLAAAIDRISAFLGWQVSAEGRARAIEHSSFAWMKQHSEKFTRMSKDGPTLFKAGTFIRQGKVGGHGAELTQQQSEALLARARKELPRECLEYLGIA